MDRGFGTLIRRYLILSEMAVIMDLRLYAFQSRERNRSKRVCSILYVVFRSVAALWRVCREHHDPLLLPQLRQHGKEHLNNLVINFNRTRYRFKT